MTEQSTEPLRPLIGVRVLELGRQLGVASAGLNLAALGAEVVQVRHPERCIDAADAVYYDRGRLVAELSDRVQPTAAAADVIVTDLPRDELDALGVPSHVDALRAGPRPQVLVLVSSMGRSGPHCELRMTDLTEWAAGGLAPVTRRPHLDDPDAYVPVLPPGCQPQALAGIAAATGAVAARRQARRTARPVVAEVSAQEVVAAMLHGVFAHWVWYGIVTGHRDTPATARGMLLPAADGDVYLRTLDPRQWDALMEWIDDDTVRALGTDANARLANHDALELLIGTWTASQPREALLVEAQRRRVPVALPRSLDDVLAWQHLRARGAWRPAQLDGRATEVPRLPLLEPPAWDPTEAADLDEVAARWAAA